MVTVLHFIRMYISEESFLQSSMWLSRIRYRYRGEAMMRESCEGTRIRLFTYIEKHFVCISSQIIILLWLNNDARFEASLSS